MKDARDRSFRFADVEVDVRNLRVTVGSEIRPLEPKSFRLLLFLVENPGRVLAKDEIMAVVWPGSFVSDNSLARAITQIRKALDDDPKAPKYIETVPSVGYRFVAEVGETRLALAPEPPLGRAGAESVDGPPAKPRSPMRLQFIAAASGAMVLLILAVWYFRGTPAPDRAEMRVEIDTPATNDPRSFALSPDGRQLTYVATADGKSTLWVRQLASTEAQPLTATEGGAAYPFWSPDSRWIGFFSGGKLKRIQATGGLPLTITDAKSGRGGTWNQDGVILFTPDPQSGLFRVSATGGEAAAVTKLEWAGSHRFAQFLPDGRHFLYYAEGSPEKPGPGVIGSVYLGSLDSGDNKRLTGADTAGLYMPPGWLLWIRSGVLVAQHLNISKGELSGDAFTVADPVFFDTSHARLFSVAATGLVTYRNGTPTAQLRWFDRSGKALGALVEPAEKDGYNPSVARISPDGRRVAVHRRVREHSDLWLMDDVHANRFTFDGAGNPVWSPDGRRIAFGGGDNGSGSRYYTRFFLKPTDGTQNQTPVVDTLPELGALDDWSPDGSLLLYQTVDLKTGYDLWTLPLEGDRKPKAFQQTKFDEKYARFSPDGRWVAFTSNQSGRSEIYVRAFDAATAASAETNPTGGVWQLSVEGGIFPAWRHDGKELYWVGPGGRMMAVPFTVKEATPEPGTPVPLFQAPIFGGGLDVNTGGEQFDVSSDGRFLINTVKDNAATAITLLQNWKSK